MTDQSLSLSRFGCWSKARNHKNCARTTRSRENSICWYLLILITQHRKDLLWYLYTAPKFKRSTSKAPQILRKKGEKIIGYFVKNERMAHLLMDIKLSAYRGLSSKTPRKSEWKNVAPGSFILTKMSLKKWYPVVCMAPPCACMHCL